MRGQLARMAPDQAAQVAADLHAARPLCRSQDRTDEPTLAVEDDDRLEAVGVVVGVEQTQLLAAVYGVEGVVDVEHDPPRRLPERGTVEIDHRPPHGDQLANAGEVLQATDRRLGGEIATRWERILGHLEHGIGAQAIGVVAVLVAGGDHLHAKADHVGEAVDDLVRRARIVKARRQALGDAQPPIHLRQRDHAAVRRQQAAVETGDHGLAANR